MEKQDHRTRVAAERRERMRRRLFGSALQLVAKQGPAATSVDQVIQAAVGGQGVALGRIPLIAEHLRDGRLTAPFPKRYDSARGYYAVVAPHANERADVAGFVGWLSDEAARELGHDPPPAGRRRRA